MVSNYYYFMNYIDITINRSTNIYGEFHEHGRPFKGILTLI